MAEELFKEVEKGIADLFADGTEDKDRHNTTNPYMNIEKSSVLLAARDFHDSNIVRDNPERIVTTITQLLYLQNSKAKNSTSIGGGVVDKSDSTLNRTEATDIFFGVTKLFVSTNHKLLRRMVYVVLKDLITLCHPSDIIIVTSCLTKDMTSKDAIYRANALRVLARIIDASMLSAIERYIKQAILESSVPSSSITATSSSHATSTNNNMHQLSSTNSFQNYHQHGLVSSAALVSSLHLYQQSNENAHIVKRWVNEVYEALRSGCGTSHVDNPHNMVQFHALILYYQMKKSDRLAISKFVQTFCSSTMSMMDKSTKVSSGTGSSISSRHHSSRRRSSSSTSSNANVPSLTSPLAITCLIRYTFKLLYEEIIEGRIASFTHSTSSSPLCTIGYTFLKSCLRHESEMVAFEAASSICSLSTVTTSSNEVDNAATLEDIQPALSVLQLLLSSHKPAARLGTIKLLYRLSIKYPQFVCGRFNDSLEALIGDSNRLIGTLSIMTLMKTFAGSTKNNNGDDTAIDRLLKHISSFISHIADEYKIMVIKSLEQLCISYPMKFSIIISFLSKFLRDEGGFLFKRTIVTSVESLMEAVPETRSLALLYLCEFIEDCEYVTLSTQILALLGNLGPTTTSPSRYVRFIYNRCILENHMIRAASVSALSKFGASCPSLRLSILTLLRSCLLDESDETRDRVVLAIEILEQAEIECPFDASDANQSCHEESKENVATMLLMTKLPFSFDVLEQRLKSYKGTPGTMECNESLSFHTLPELEHTPIETELEDSQNGIMNTIESTKKEKLASRLDVLNNIPEFAAFGRIFLSSSPIPLTETETEYVVHCIKHIYDNHIVIQFITQNTIEDQRLENVSVTVENDSDSFNVIGEMPAKSISYGNTESCFTILERNSNMPITALCLQCELKFTIVQVDPSSGEVEGESYEEEYPLEDLEIFTTDFIAKTTAANFRESWESAGNSNEILQKFQLQEKNLESAVRAIIDCLGMQTCDGTHALTSTKQHMLHLSGTFLGGVQLVARSQISISPSGSVILKIAIRSGSPGVSQLVAACLG
jgi:coatomer protein complex subunit gamma